eukprot:CAMPEP_0116874146 /NCGR_PEP_ID=MMETSP0463-20121206/5584_1 /TAXON_ID=181622 /ORGANISM="Strombidinopsis sp, Strain SopsisLIS2011" /LENGTH=75 /DNA_ID=CAMNT_0004517451 /DNA_START=680 /DNA_END=907 /DNA_ORIENTATION=+
MICRQKGQDDDFVTLDQSTPGSGACGGLVAGLTACFGFENSKIISGMDFIMNNCDLITRVNESFLIITGEGSVDY